MDRRAFLAGGTAILGASGCAGDPDVTPAPSSRGQTIVIDGVALHYERLGSGPPLVLIHGASGNLRDWTYQAAGRFAATNDVIVFDRPGHGLSGAPETGVSSLSLQAALMRAALADMGVDRAIVTGHSYGGSVALAWALDAPDSVNGLMLLAAPSHEWPGGVGFTSELLANPALGPFAARSASALVTDGFARRTVNGVFEPQQVPVGYLEHLRLDLILQPSALRANALQLTALKQQITMMQTRYGELAMPVEILHGNADDTVWLSVHSEALARETPVARLTTLDGIGHMPHHARPQDVTDAIDRAARRAGMM